MLRRAVFFDRDGVLNEAVVRNSRPYPPAGLADLRICHGAREALESLRDAGFVLICVTNQPDVARGTADINVVNAMNEVLLLELPLDEIVMCVHDDVDGCACRKPKPGMIIDAALRHHIDPDASYLVGDRWRDIEAGIAAGCWTLFVDRGYAEEAPDILPDICVGSVVEAAAWILANSTTEQVR
jgi:D-glycero-D-manno-heptose 1,7-bisphosphate phosphatase